MSRSKRSARDQKPEPTALPNEKPRYLGLYEENDRTYGGNYHDADPEPLDALFASPRFLRGD